LRALALIPINGLLEQSSTWSRFCDWTMEGFIGFLDEALELLISLVSRSCPWYVAEVNTLIKPNIRSQYFC